MHIFKLISANAYVFHPTLSPLQFTFNATHCVIQSHYHSKGFSGPHEAAIYGDPTVQAADLLCGAHGTPFRLWQVKYFVS